ncbi:MAG: TlpA family protein disulfide reductase [Acidimicrobiia bacterium]|nr:TlpA family protein disulfide reductase [Acidimicrobiia bacterium]
MSNNPSRKIARRRQHHPPNRADDRARRNRLLLLGGLAAAVIFALVIAAAVTTGGDDDSVAAGSNVASDIEGETGQAEIIGDPLPRHDTSLATDPAVGATAPDISASQFDGTRVSIDTADGTGRLIGFFAHWCPHCQREIPTVVDWMAQGAVPDGVEVVALSTGVSEGDPNYPPSAWFEREGFTGAVLRDSADDAVATGYGLSGFPYWVAVDADGTVMWRASGEQTPEQLAAMAELVS